MKTRLLLLLLLIMGFTVSAQETFLFQNFSVNDTTYELNVDQNAKAETFTITIQKTPEKKETSNNLTYSIDQKTFVQTIIGILKKEKLEGKYFIVSSELNSKFISIYEKLYQKLIGKRKTFLGIKKSTKPKEYNSDNTDPNKVNQKTAGITNTYEIRYNFKTKVYDRNLLGPKINHPIVYKIENINRIAYDIKISSRDSTLTKGEDVEIITPSESTKEAKKVETLEMETIRIDVLNSENTNMDGINDETRTSLKNKVEAHKFEVVRLNGLLDQTHSDIKRKNEEIKALRDSFDKSNTDSVAKTNYNSIEKELDEKLTKYITEKDSLNDLIIKQKDAISRNENSLSEEEKKLQKINNFNNDYSKLSEKHVNLNNRINEINEIFKNNNILVSIARNPQIYSVEDYNVIAKDSLGDYTQIDKIYSRRECITQYSKEYTEFKLLYSKIKNNFEIIQLLKSVSTYKDIIKSIEEINTIVEKNNTKILDQNPNQVITNMITLIQYLKNPETYSITSAPIQPTQDVVIFDVDIKTKKGLDYNNERKFSHKEYTKGGVRYDFSTGLVLGFGVNDYSFSKETIYNTDLQPIEEMIVERENTNEYLPAVGAMLHVSLRNHRLVSFGLTLGASISTTELDLNSLFPGISILIGKTEKIIITAGPALKKIQYIKSDFDVDKAYPVGTLPSSFETQSTFRQGWFVGLTYNLTNKQKSNYTIANK